MSFVDGTPSWEAAARIYIAALEAGPSDGADAAREEMLRLARQYEDACREIAVLRGALDRIAVLADEGTEIERLARAARL